jgi:hypothetical protein
VYKLRRNNVQGGGVGIYVKTEFNFIILPQLSVYVDRVFESLFIEITMNSNKIIIGSVYRPGTKHPGLSSNEQFSQFTDLLSNLCNELSSVKHSIYIAGDINLDVLRYNSNPNVTEYVDLLFSYGFLQTITRPTRISQNSATVIDHIISNVTSSCHETVIITSRISDHFPIFYLNKVAKPKASAEYFETRDFSQAKLDYFKLNLTNVNWNSVCTEQDTQSAFNTFSSLFLIYMIYTSRFCIKNLIVTSTN